MCPSTPTPLVSVIIPAYNAAGFIERAIESALKQTYQPIEIVVVDDGSTDNTRKVVEAIDGPIRYFHQENAGPAVARTKAIEESRGEIVALLDADDEWLPERLKKTVEPMLADPEIGLSYCLTYHQYNDGSKNIYGEKSVPAYQPDGVYPPPYLQTSAATFRRHVFDRCGYFDPQLRNCQDIDLFLRVMDEYEVYRVDAPLNIYHARTDSHSGAVNPDHASEMLFRYVCKALGRAKTPRNRDGAMAVAYSDIGIRYFDARQRIRALRYFLVSWLLRPRRRTLLFCMRTLMPSCLNRQAHRLRHRRAPR